MSRTTEYPVESGKQFEKSIKYYVESGRHFKYVVLARDPLDAVFQALDCHGAFETVGEPLELADFVIVGERGFVWDRPQRQLRGDETAFRTAKLLGPPKVKPASDATSDNRLL